MNHLFGTDGIRGVAGRSPLSSKDIFLIGQAAGHVLRQKTGQKNCRVLAVRDTRQSGLGILKQLSSGLRSQGVDVYDAGVLCTPSVAHLVRVHKFQSGVVISASHNPPQFNGIEFFSAQSRKWPDEWERDVESLFSVSRGKLHLSSTPGQHIKADTLHEDYREFLIDTLGLDADFSNFRIALDCSNGANFDMAPDVFRELGATVFTSAVHPNGRNINVGCGSQHTERLQKIVVKKKCHAGIAFDGDGDRVIFVDEKGHELDGDYLIAILANDFKKRKVLARNKVVLTVMANLGLKKALSKMGIGTLSTPVGDRYVSQAMQKAHAVLGGEQSGHIILGRWLPTGDGLLTALHVMAAVKNSKQPLSVLSRVMRKYPQVLLNVPVKEKRPLSQLNGVDDRIKAIEKKLGDDGRILVRYSGTEPLLRIMLEGPDKKVLDNFANDVARLVVNAQ